MCCFLMHLISENPWYGPEMFGALCDAFLIVTIVYCIVEKVRSKR